MSQQSKFAEISRDAIVLGVGVVLVASTIWLPVQGDRGVSAALLILGMLSAGTALWAMSSASRSSHWTHLVLGLALALSPAVLAFPSGIMTADLFAIVGGLVIAGMGVLGVVATPRAMSPARVVASSVEGVPVRVRN